MRLAAVLLLVLAFALQSPSTPIDAAAKSVTSTASGQAYLLKYEAAITRLLAEMTIDEKVGQMTQAEHGGIKDISDVDRLFLGSVLSGGDADPEAGNSLSAWTEVYERYQARTQMTRLRIPLLYGVDAVHGHNNVLGATVFPHNIGLGCTRNPKLVEQISKITAEEVRATGMNWAFAPCVAVVRDERWGRTYEGFGETPELAKVMGAAAVRGLQLDNLKSPLSVLACAKHYAGDGGTIFGTGMPKGPSDRYPLDRGDVRMTEAEFREMHLQGYISSLEQGVASIMPSYNSFNGEKCSGSQRLLTGILKNELGFQGLLISDYNAIEELPGDYRGQIEKSVNAGMDMFMITSRYKEFISILKQLVADGKVPMTRIDDAVRRILRVKFAMGLMDKNRKLPADRTLHKNFGSAAHRAVARQAVRESLVLLKNENKVLPISKKLARIHVAGKSADDLGNQCGGWTIKWQGQSGNFEDFGTTILKAVQKSVGTSTTVTYTKNGEGAKGADVGIVVIGETPYAEFFGDRKELELGPEDVEAIRNMKSAGIPVVVVLISGRPMNIGSILSQCDAFIAAWLPGTEGEGVTDVLFGDFKPTGKLSHTWPRSTSQLPINFGDKNYDPLFKYGFGLSW